MEKHKDKTHEIAQSTPYLLVNILERLRYSLQVITSDDTRDLPSKVPDSKRAALLRQSAANH